MTWIVMTSSAHVSASRQKYSGQYRNVAVVSVRYDLAWTRLTYPRLISERAKGVYVPQGAPRAVIHLGAHNVGKTDRCAYAQAKLRAEEIAQQLNNSAPDALPSELFTLGGSA